jgi:hypothetical protein
MKMAHRSLMTGCIATFLAFIIAGCSGPTTGTPSTPREPERTDESSAISGGGIDVTPQLDEDLGRVVLPYDRFTFDGADVSLLRQAVNVEVALCAREQGIDFVASPMFADVEVYRSESFFGPWTMEQAQKFGFIEPMRDADLRANGFVPEGYGTPSDQAWIATVEHNGPVIEEYQAQLDECSEQADTRLESIREVPNSPWHAELWAIQESLGKDKRVEEAVAKLEQCLRDRNLKPIPGNPGYVEGFDVNQITEEQILLAIQTVECKEEVDFTQTVASAWASLQEPVLARYAREIVAQGEANARALEDARALISANSEVLEPLQQ